MTSPVGTTTLRAPEPARGAADAVVRAAARVWRFGASRTLTVLTLAMFTVTAAFFALVVFVPPFDGVVDGVPFVARTSRVPDEFRHIGNVLLYVERPWWSGPVISDVSAPTLWLGEVERFPSYLYYWVASVPARALLAAGAGYETVVVALRLLTVLTGTACLVVLRSLLVRTGVGAPAAGWSVLALSLTGRFVWQSAGVSYDTPSMLLFLVVVLAAVRLVQRVTVVWSLVLVAAASLAAITKYTFLPFIGLLVVALVVVLVVQGRRRGPGLRAELAAELRARRALVAVLALVTLVAVVLVVERIGLNLLTYRSVNPRCDLLHDADACMGFDIYRRNLVVKERYHAEIADGLREPQSYAPLAYTRMWLDIYYSSSFFYRGRYTTWAIPGAVVALAYTGLAVGTALVVRWSRRLLRTPAAALVGGISIVYVVGVYVFNLRTWLSLAQVYAHSGRYLLPVLGVAVAAVLVAARWSFLRLPTRGRAVAAIVVACYLVAVLVTHHPLVAFFGHVDEASWFVEAVRPTMQDLLGLPPADG